ncbi:heavy-metal-associated domain-containing protein [Aeoliella sp. ICT_H6.2]|uniref:Heavy-metal-associated domain-containing protein n=1 Tax=Aeoliella straminimaris TaxID=2954799 RepID=A0A9X2FEF0_9BACT|nr:heavy-metal-associated domain-containing protein [Aeoliella straminimaris]MCO6046507.1 heavy-metal-associated domain-containing protein [Aeoliella straminimaris]
MRSRILSLTATTLTLVLLSTSAFGQQPASPPPAGQVQITAKDMCCKGCAQKVAGQLYTIKGVKSVGVDLPTRTVTVSLGQQDPATLGALWHAAQRANGGPTQIATETASYTLVLPKTSEEAEQIRKLGTTQQVVVGKLDSQQTAQQIASRLYELKGVAKVRVDLQHSALVLETKPNTPVSAWLVIDAVAKAGHQVSAVSGNFGTLSIEYAGDPAHEYNQASQPRNGAVQR